MEFFTNQTNQTNQTILSEEQFVQSCREFYMHLYNWDILGYDNDNKYKLVKVLPSVEKTRDKLDKDFLPTKFFNPYTKLFTQKQIDATGSTWIPYACYLADEAKFVQVIADGSWSDDPLHETHIDIQKVQQDYPEQIAQYLVAFNIAKSNCKYKPGYDRVSFEFSDFINTLDLAIQMYKFGSNMDNYAVGSSYYTQTYGQEFMDKLESKLIFSNYSEERAKRERDREEEEKARVEAERKRKESGILSFGENQKAIINSVKEIQGLGIEISRLKIKYFESQAKLYKKAYEGSNSGNLDPSILELIQTSNSEYKTNMSELKTKSETIIAKSKELIDMQAASSYDLTSSLNKICDSFKSLELAFKKDKELEEMYKQDNLDTLEQMP